MTGVVIALNRIPDLGSAIASFFVTDPVKSLNIDRGYSADDTSQINVFDDEAINGYIIKARLDPAIDANFTVRIWSADSAICTATNPCQLSTNDTVIYGNGTDSATIDNSGSGGTRGDVIDFDVRINASMAINIGAHDVDIIYTKERAATMQAFNTAMCNAMPIYYNASDPTPWNPVNPPAGSEVDLMDIRDGKVYKIRKLPTDTIGTTGQCWMVDNLALQPTAANPMILDSDNSDITSGTYTLTAANVMNPNIVISPTYCIDRLNGTITDNQGVPYTHGCGMQYAWTTAATGSIITTGTTPDSICPNNWRLPMSGEYTTLQTALRWGVAGANVNASSWRGLYVGFNGESTYQGSYGQYWLATASSATNAYNLVYYASNVSPNYSGNGSAKSYGMSLRCLAR